MQIIEAHRIGMLKESIRADSGASVVSESIFLPSDGSIKLDLGRTRDASAKLACYQLLERLGLNDQLLATEVIVKSHQAQAARDAAVAEQFYHVDVAQGSFAGLFLIGMDSRSIRDVPRTHVVDNSSLHSFILEATANGPLEGRLKDVWVVRPQYDKQDLTEWHDYTRHTLQRYVDHGMVDLLSEEQRAHLETDTSAQPPRGKYIGRLSVAKLLQTSQIDGEIVPTCGASSREIRLSLGKDQTAEEAAALRELHIAITRLLLARRVRAESHQVDKGSALFIPASQVHRAEPYRPNSYRPVVTVKCAYANGRVPAASWTSVPGSEAGYYE